jgi:predicted DNA-binding ribbon-helix-helix protein
LLAYAFPYRRFAAALAGVRARLRVDADRYSLIVSDFHRLLLAGLSGALRKIPYVIGLKDIAKGRRTTLSDLATSIDIDREHGNLSSALRLLVLGHYQKRAASGSVVDNFARSTEYTIRP